MPQAEWDAAKQLFEAYVDMVRAKRQKMEDDMITSTHSDLAYLNLWVKETCGASSSGLAMHDMQLCLTSLHGPKQIFVGKHVAVIVLTHYKHFVQTNVRAHPV